MGSKKFILNKETKNLIADYIDNEFISETIKEIVHYIKEEHKVEIDSSKFDELNEDSRVELIDKGSFNVLDYIYVKDFLEELSWSGEYLRDTDNEDIFKYVPRDIASIIYENVRNNMTKKKNELFKEFKKQYNEEFLFNSVSWYKRSRDGKDYFDLDINELNEDAKRSYEERIKTELSNFFKSKWANPVETKVLSLNDELLINVYEKGCRLLNIENDYAIETIKEQNTEDEKLLIDMMIENCKNVNLSSKQQNTLKMKAINSIDKKINHLLNMEIYKVEDYMESFLETARNLVFGYYKSMAVKGKRDVLKNKEDGIYKIIRRIAVVENILYEEYLETNEKAPSIEEMIEFRDCISWICFKGLIWTAENIYIKNKAKDDIQEILTDDPFDEYPEARLMKRHFYLHVGETNTGKTYSSIERLKEAESGVYLAPLRLLALEIQDKLNSENVPCSLLTGEEEDIISYATHTSSTIEKLQTSVEYEVCVIDEAQMIADTQRGWAWTKAIMAVLAEEVHVCMAPEALDIIIKLITDCNDTYEIINHTRDTELIFESRTFNLDYDVKQGDALVVFGKKKALAVSAELLNKGIKTSIIYGSLPYSTRKRQFDRFLNKETEVIVCTDAIGMGVNLPIKRIVFLETRKYDGISLRRLNISEIKQIAGRAGRRGIYDQGYVAAATDVNLIRGALNAKPDSIKKCFIGIPDSLINIDKDIVDTLKTWSSMNIKGYFEKTDVTRVVYLLNKLKKMHLNCSNEDIVKMATIPFEENNKIVYALWEEYCRMYSSGAVNLRKPPLPKNVNSKKELDDLESYYKSLDLNYSFGKNFKMMINNRYIISEKENAANKINEILLVSLLDHERKCTMCGKKLSWDYPNDICRKCRELLYEVKKDKPKRFHHGARRRRRFK